MKHLETQRQILLAESELNRAQLLKDIERLHDEWGHLTATAKIAGSVVSSFAKFGTMFLFLRRVTRLARGRNNGAMGSHSKSKSMLGSLLSSVGTGLFFWDKLRSRR